MLDYYETISFWWRYSFVQVFISILTVIIGGDIIREISISGIIITILYAILFVVLGNLLLYGFQNFDSNVGTIILTTEIFITIALGYIFLGESPTQKELVGGIFIFALLS